MGMGMGMGMGMAKITTPFPILARSDELVMLKRNPSKGKKLLIVVNDAQFFLSHRLNIAVEARAAGYNVSIACPRHQRTDVILANGLRYYQYDVQRATAQFVKDCFSVIQIFAIFLRVRPDIVHLVTAKPVIVGGILARVFNIPTVAAVTGLGYVYSSNRALMRFLRIFMNWGYRCAIKHNRCITIFQNSDNMEYFKKHRLVGCRISTIKGSGTNLSSFASDTQSQVRPPIVLMPCRMLATKGVLIFLEAAEIVNKNRRVAYFMLAGALDPGNPAAVSQKILEDATAQGIAEWVGYQSDIASLMMQSSLVVLPSFYNEGLPKTLVDAAAAGRAVITTDIPGCRDAIIPNKTGLLVEPHSAEDLAYKITELLNDDERRNAMGRAGRDLAERDYCDTAIARQHILLYDEMIDSRREVIFAEP
jgi:glycosyltransferase involved in cell wall biosynthesis